MSDQHTTRETQRPEAALLLDERHAEMKFVCAVAAAKRAEIIAACEASGDPDAWVSIFASSRPYRPLHSPKYKRLA